MAVYWLTIVVAATASALLTYALSKLSRKRKIFIPELRDRDLHRFPVPRVGGIAVVLTVIILALAISFVRPSIFTFSAETFLGIDKNVIGLIIAAVILSLVNVIDDYRGVDWRLRLATQIISACLIYWFGIRIGWLSNPFGGQIILGALDLIFIVVWIVTISNTINFLDGIDGLASGIGAIALTVLLFLSLSPGVDQPQNALLCAMGIGAIMGFLPFNFIGPKVFLGDTGAVFIGFLVAVVAIISGGKIATVFLVLAIPFLDVIVVIISRLLEHRSPFMADKGHLHHRLLALGLQPYQVALLLWGVSLLFGLIALNTQTLGKFATFIIAIAIMMVLVAIYRISPKPLMSLSKKKQDG